MIKGTYIRDINSQREYEKIKYHLQKKLYQIEEEGQFTEVIFLCVGTNRLVGDMVGPIVGEKLMNKVHHKRIQKLNNREIVVYGNMQHTLNLKNANEIIQYLQYKYKRPFIITIDAALGSEDMIEKILIGSGKIEIGKALENEIQYQSNIYIKGIVGKYSTVVEENMNTLKSANIASIQRISNIIYDGIIAGIKKI